MESASSRPVLTSLASIAFSLAVVFLFLAVRGIWPFGGRFLEYMDNGQLVYPTLKYYASALMSGAFDGAFFYDVNGGAGIRVSPTLPHQLLIPSTWIAVAMGDSFLLKDMVWVMLADVACICVTASWFLRRVFPSLPVCWTVLLTAGYAVGGFFQTKYGFMQFLDHAAMFPLFALGLYRLVNGGRGWLYAAGLFLLATSLYSAFMAVVTGWMFAWAFTLPLKGTRERRVRLARVFWYTAAVTLATCYYWLPMAEMSRDSMRSLFMTPPTFFELSWPFDPPKFLERLYACLPGMSFAALAAGLSGLREEGVPGAGQREAPVYPSSGGVRFARVCRAHPPRRPFMELRGFSRPVRFYSQSGGNVVLRLDFVRRQASGAGRTAMGVGMEPGASHSGFFLFPVCPEDDGCGSCGASSAFAVFCMRMAVLEACGGQKAGVVHRFRDDAGAAHRGWPRSGSRGRRRKPPSRRSMRNGWRAA